MSNSALQGSSRFWSRSALVAALGPLVVAGLAAGCASELDEPDSYTVAGGGGAGPTGGVAPATGGISNNGGSTGGTVSATGGAPVAGAAATGGMMGAGAPPLSPCVKTLFANNCAMICHSTAFKDSFGGLDLSGDNVGERLRNAMALNSMATDKAACGSKLIDADNPANSVLTKRVAGKGVCGPEMPTGAQLGAGDVKCIQDWVNTF